MAFLPKFIIQQRVCASVFFQLPINHTVSFLLILCHVTVGQRTESWRSFLFFWNLSGSAESANHYERMELITRAMTSSVPSRSFEALFGPSPPCSVPGCPKAGTVKAHILECQYFRPDTCTKEELCRRENLLMSFGFPSRQMKGSTGILWRRPFDPQAPQNTIPLCVDHFQDFDAKQTRVPSPVRSPPKFSILYNPLGKKWVLFSHHSDYAYCEGEPLQNQQDVYRRAAFGRLVICEEDFHAPMPSQSLDFFLRGSLEGSILLEEEPKSPPTAKMYCHVHLAPLLVCYKCKCNGFCRECKNTEGIGCWACNK